MVPGLGTDYTQQNAAQVAVTNAVANGTTTVTSATAGFTSGMTGNLAYFAGGTGSIVGTWRQVTFVNSTTITVDSLIAASTGMTLNLGGAIDSPTTLAAMAPASFKAWVQAGTYAAAPITFAQAVTPSATVPFNHIIGYSSVRGDIAAYTANQGSRPQVLCTTLGGIAITAGAGTLLENLAWGPSGVASIAGGCSLAGNSGAVNCKVSTFSANGIFGSGTNTFIQRCEATGGTLSTSFGISGNTCQIVDNWAHDNTGGGIKSSGGTVARNVATNNTTDGITIAVVNGSVFENTCQGNGRDGIRITASAITAFTCMGNLLTNSGGWGINQTTAAWPAMYTYDGNAFYNNTSGNRANIDDTSTNPVDSSSPYANTQDVILTADPYVSAAGNDYRLNATAGGGLACRGAGLPRSWPGLAFAAGPDMGAAQSVAGSPATSFPSRVFSGY